MVHAYGRLVHASRTDGRLVHACILTRATRCAGRRSWCMRLSRASRASSVSFCPRLWMCVWVVWAHGGGGTGPTRRDRTNVCWSSARTPATSEQAPDHARAHAHAHRHVQTHLHTRVQKCQRARAQARRRKQANSRTLGRTHGRTRGMARGRTLGRKLESTRALDRTRQHSSTKLPANATALEALTHREGGGRAGELARAIATRHAESALRVVCIAGPTASGKTTFSHKLALALRAQGLCACVRARETQRY